MKTGCKTCLFFTLRFGDADCLLKPHDYKSPLQRDIVKWLQWQFANGDDAPNGDGCPGWQVSPHMSRAEAAERKEPR